jgi:hypothetical protein
MPAKKTSEELEELLEECEPTLTNNDQMKEYLTASKQFNELVEQGVVQKRGYTLMTPDQAHLYRIEFNMPQKY